MSWKKWKANKTAFKMDLMNHGAFVRVVNGKGKIVKKRMIAAHVECVVFGAYVVVANADAKVPVRKLLSKELQINRGSKAPTNAYSGCRCNTNKKTNNKR